MKKVLFFAIILGGLAFTSCSKSACECTILGATTTTEDVDKSDCDDADTAAQAFGGSCKSV